MFERYTDQCKRAIFFAQQTALRGGSALIDSGHLLLGLVTEKDTRAETIFRLQELLPEESAKQVALPAQPMMKGTIPLSNDSKRVVAYTAIEAGRIKDYWIDTEHLVLGILREEGSAPAAKLRSLGLELVSCREMILHNRSSRLSRPNRVLWWVGTHPVTFAQLVLLIFLFGIAVALVLLGWVAMGIACAVLTVLYFFQATRREGSAR
jgi:ATP-dependent Clp protease ATP-binding subunit ClpC